MKHALKLLLTTLSIGVLSACGNNATGTNDNANTAKSGSVSPIATTSATTAGQTLSVDAFRPAATVAAQDSPIKARDLTVAPTPTNIVLGAPLASQTTAARQSNEAVAADTMGKPLQIGFGRDVAQTATASATNQVLKWQATKSGGQVAAINFNSSGAKGMRVGLLVTQLPETATLRFYAKGATTAFEVKGADVLAVIAKNLAAGDKTDEGRTYWGPDINGTDAIVEVEIPSGQTTNSVVLSVPKLSHIFMSSKEISTATAQINYTGDTNLGLTCQVDVTCSSPIPASTDAVTHLRFIKNGGSYICSGTMLNDNISSSTNYVLSANHCISSQAVASTLETWFKYRSTTCNNGATGEYYPTYGGADLLYTAYNTDSTLLKLSNPPTASGVLYAGWDAATAPANSTVVHSVHHPKGDQQRLSRGSITGYSTRSATNPNSFIGSNITNGTILDVTLTTGLTEGGSSGSGLFKGTDANPILIGQLFGGSTPGNAANGYAPACTTATPPVAMPPNNVYGRFDVAFKEGMSDWLVQGAKPVYRFYNRNNDSHFYTKSVTESNNIKQFLTHYRYEGPAFNASSIGTAGLSPVYRFYNTASDSHFFTISATERTNILTNLKHYRDEGIAWYAQEIEGNGAIPLYRFYNTAADVHFFTSSETEKDSIIANLKHFRFEGIRYYVQPL
jgi:lysyl endopeptidase